MQAEHHGSEADASFGAADGPASDTTEGSELSSAARRLLEQGGETARAAADTAAALSALTEAELALARVAAPRAVLLGIAAFGLAVAATFYLLALMVALLHHVGLDWPMALAAATLIAFLGALLLAWRAKRVWSLTKFVATRRQFSRLLSDAS